MYNRLKYFILSFFLVTSFLIFKPISVQAQINVPTVSFLGVDHSPLVAGDTEKFTITSKGYSGKVQYRVFVLNQSSGKWTELTSGYSAPVNAATPYMLSPPNTFEAAKYTLRTYVKRYGQTGITRGGQCGGYDTLYTSYMNCVARDDSRRLYASDDMDISQGKYVVGQKIQISGIKNISGKTGPYKYRLHLFSPDKIGSNTNGWVNGWKMNAAGTAYTSTIEWTPTEPGTYILDLWAISSDSTFWTYLNQNPSAKYYDSWKLLKITVASDLNSYTINSQTDLYNALTDGLTRVSPKIYLDTAGSTFKSDTSKISETVNKIIKDNPDLNTFDTYTIGYNYVSFQYLYSQERIFEMRKLVDDKVNEIIASVITPNMTSLEKEKAIHDYVINNTEYDYDGYTSNQLTKEDFTAYGCLINKKAVCQGYASAMWKLLSKAGIDTILVYGTADGVEHAWNIVNIDGKYYHLDATFDDPIVYINGVRSNSGIVDYKYFNITDAEISADHIWDKTQYPVCD